MSLDKTAILKILASKFHHNKFHLQSYEHTQLECKGMMGEHGKLLCHIRKEHSSKLEEHKFFVKKRSPREQTRSENISYMVFNKEVATYHMFNTINLPKLNNSVPKFFYSDKEQLVLEDLLAEGYKTLPTYQVATEEELLVVLKTLACMHAASIAYEERETAKQTDQKPVRLYKQFPKVFSEIYMDASSKYSEEYHNAIIKGLITAIGIFNLPEKLKNGKLLRNELNRFWDLYKYQIGVKPSLKYRNVMSHSDLWAENLFMKYDESGKPHHAKIIDFQMERYLPAAFDVLHYILTNTTRNYRKKHMLRIKQTYYNNFCKYLEEYDIDPLNIYTFNEFLESFKEIEMFCIYIAINIISMVQSDITASELRDQEYYNSIVMVDRSSLFLKSTKNKQFMERLKDCLLDMIEYFENN